MTDNNTSHKRRFKNFAPWIGLGILTVGLMIFFKFSEQGYSDLQVKGNNLLAKYTENLSPLYATSELSNEDVFNFALYNNLPIDKDKNRMFTIESDSYGNENYVVAELDSLPATKNLELYKNKLGLNSTERESIDSILNNYKEDLYSSILLADNQSIALAPKIALLQKAIGTDIYEFALRKKQSTGSGKSKVNYAVDNKEKIVSSLRQAGTDDSPEEFIFMTPDTVFSHDFAINKRKLNESLKQFEAQKKSTGVQSDWSRGILSDQNPSAFAYTKIPEDQYSYQFDSNYYKLTLPVNEFLNENSLDYDSLKWGLENLAKDFASFQFALSGYEKGIKMMIEANDGLDKENVEIQFNFENLGDFIGKTVSAAMTTDPEEWEKFGKQMDSLSKALSTFENDSAAFIQIKQAAEKIKNSKKKNNNRKD